jgi:hypothetical protein
MKYSVSKVRTLSLLAFLAIGLVACGVGGDTGRLSLSLTDASTDVYAAVYITIKEVAVHAEDDMEDSWTVVATPNKTINLLSLVNGVREQLALADLTAGHYTQLRLMIGDTKDNGVNILSEAHYSANYVIDADGHQYHDMKVPSGFQTGVKIVQGFDIDESRTTELLLDFDASRSVVVAGKSGKYLLKPTIQMLSTSLASIISGTVTKAADQGKIEGALVSAQVYNAAAADLKDRVVVKASTLSNETGGYKIFIAAGPYHLVAIKPGFAPSPFAITTTAGQTMTQDFALAAATEAGKIAGTVTITGAGDETFATLSFRQTVTLNATTEVTIEVMSVNVASGGSYSVDLPAGSYVVVSSTAGRTTQEAPPVSVTKDVTTTLDITIPF